MATHLRFGQKLPHFNPAALPQEYMPRMADAADENHPKHYLIPGKIFASADPVAITTIVGTGVTLCLHDPIKKIGGANHFTLPVQAEASCKALLETVLKLGAELHNLEAKIFGGSQPTVTFSNPSEWLGNRNVEAALKFLGERGIRLGNTETGGTHGRKLIFHTDDGKAWAQAL